MTINHGPWLITMLAILVALGISISMEAIMVAPVLVIVAAAWLTIPTFCNFVRAKSHVMDGRVRSHIAGNLPERRARADR